MFSALHSITFPLYTIAFRAICLKYILILCVNLFSPFFTSERFTSLSQVRNRERIKRYVGGGSETLIFKRSGRSFFLASALSPLRQPATSYWHSPWDSYFASSDKRNLHFNHFVYGHGLNPTHDGHRLHLCKWIGGPASRGLWLLHYIGCWNSFIFY